MYTAYEPLHLKAERPSSNSDADEQEDFSYSQPSALKIRKLHLAIFVGLLVVSNVSTWLLCGQTATMTGPNIDPRTPFAGLERNVPMPFQESNPYVSSNLTHALKIWSEINIDAGMVALPEEYAEAHDLPVAQRFAWDQSKGTYLIHGYHQLHCVRAVYISLMEFHLGVEQTRAWGHVLHCLDSLRQDVICNADDTPRYSTESDRPESGMGQVRMCRSWDKLESWAGQHNACYAYVNQTANLPEIQRFLYCPEASPYRESVRKVYGDVPSYEELDLEVWSSKESFDALMEGATADSANVEY